jgi:hypothetical protein
MHKADGLTSASQTVALTNMLDQNLASRNTYPFDLDVVFDLDVDLDQDTSLLALWSNALQR